MSYALPTPTSYVSCSWQCHRDRNPPSSEPGTDYGCAYGSPVYAPEAGVISDLKTSNSNATGRYVTVDLDDGRRTRCLHMSGIWVSVGQRVNRGDQLGTSGASGYGDDWYYGPHGHQTLWSTHAYNFCSTCTIDFATYVGAGDEDDMTPEQADQLLNVYNAIFHGGPSMPDAGRSLGMSLADIANGLRPVVNRDDGSGNGVQIPWIQELADAKTNTMALLAQPPITDDQVADIAAQVAAELEGEVGGASVQEVEAIIAAALGKLTLVSAGAPDGR